LSDPGLLGGPEDLARLPTVAARPWRLAAFAWLLCVLLLAAHQWQFWRGERLATDVLALLPQAEQAPDVARAGEVLAQRVSRQVVVLLGAPDWDSARRAAGPWRAAMARSEAPLQAGAVPTGGQGADAVLDFYAPWRDRLLTPAQRAELEQAPAAAQVQRALALLHQPGAGARLADFAGDPLGLWPQWLQARAAQSRARPRDGELWVSGDGADWVVLTYEITGAPFAMNGEARYQPALDRALAAARAAVPAARMVAAGLPLHAEAAAVRASREVNTIGWGSLAAVLLLAWLAFRSVTPIALTALSLVIGVAAGVSVTAMLFGQVHLLTLVFGASLVGVAEDYGIHYFAARQGQPWARPRTLMRSLLPGLLLALLTSVLAYLALGLAPFPGLRQMAVFSAAGLAAAFLTVVCWFPLLDRQAPRGSRFATAISASLARWPRWRPGRGVWLATGAVALAALAGLAQLRASDDLRNWQGSPPELLQAQRQLGQLLGTPSVAQFYLVRGANAQEVLEREEALKERLDRIVAARALTGYAAVSDWIPSLRRQQADARLTARVESQVLAGVNAALGERLQRPAASTRSLTPEEWLAHPASAAGRALWLGEAKGEFMTVVMLHGLNDAGLLPRLAASADGLAGVRWVDRSGDIATLLGRYRWAMSALLLAGHLVVFAALWARFRGNAWRAWLPTAVASVLAVAVQGWLGEPFQLANILALLLLLGIGVDYGIFLLEHRGDGAAWLAVVLGAASTWLAFGLLALSSTPALHAFGLTLMVGIVAVWAVSPWLRPPGAPA
jgi:predicted exporter